MDEGERIRCFVKRFVSFYSIFPVVSLALCLIFVGNADAARPQIIFDDSKIGSNGVVIGSSANVQFGTAPGSPVIWC